MEYAPQKFETLVGLPGFSEALLRNHFALYEGYVANVNKSGAILADLVGGGKTGTPEFAELKRRFGWEWNGMRLHELYFGNLSREPKVLDPSSPLAQKLASKYGSVEKWEAVFKATGGMRGIGWVVLYQDPQSGELFNAWISEHDGGHLSGCVPLLVLDVFEHAYMLDYQLKKADYIEAFMKALNWEAVSKRMT